MQPQILLNKKLPPLMYGTAWKEDATERLVTLALETGFRAIDTANQRKHYHEVGVGHALKKAYDGGKVTREQLFLQTKFTSLGGQDHRLPYDPQADTATQVEQSFASSLEHLHTDWLDSYVLHGPTVRVGLADEDWQAWHAMEKLQKQGRCKFIGVSNVSMEQLKLLCASANVQPSFVQNRCFASMGWDKSVREFCRERDIVYQGFSLLTANTPVLAHPSLQSLARNLEKTPAQIVFRFALDVGMWPLTGTRSSKHMLQDLAATKFELDSEHVHAIEQILL